MIRMNEIKWKSVKDLKFLEPVKMILADPAIFLAQLPEPLLTFDLYNDFTAVGKAIQHLSEKEPTAETPGIVKDIIHHLRELLEKLPPHYYSTLQHMMYHLHM